MHVTESEQIKECAFELGATRVGIAEIRPDDIERDRERLQTWLDAGHAGEMAYLERDPERRADPRRSLEGAKSVVVLAFDYAFPSREEQDEALRSRGGAGRIARYARGRDYHRVIPKKLRQLLDYIRKICPEANGRVYVDTGPVLERAWAERSGVGWIGKHSLALHPDGGSWFFLGVVLLDVALEPDEPIADRCGTCRRCIDICPTGAIVAPQTVDSRRCISYLTIELRGDIPIELRPAVGDRIFGCDDCQEVCPWNRFASDARIDDYRARPGTLDTPLAEWLRLDDEGFVQRFQGTPIMRAKRDGFLRNVCVALGNRGRHEDLAALQHTRQHDKSEMVRRHAAWAIEAIERARQRGAV